MIPILHLFDLVRAQEDLQDLVIYQGSSEILQLPMEDMMHLYLPAVSLIYSSSLA